MKNRSIIVVFIKQDTLRCLFFQSEPLKQQQISKGGFSGVHLT